MGQALHWTEVYSISPIIFDKDSTSRCVGGFRWVRTNGII